MRRGGRRRSIPTSRNIVRTSRVTGAAGGQMEAAAPVADQHRRWGKSISATCRISAICSDCFKSRQATVRSMGSSSRATTENLFDVDGESYYARGGHHELPQSIFNKWDLPQETRRVFDQGSTGKLPNGRTDIDGVLKGHYWDEEHRQYTAATRELSERFLKERDIEPSRMTPDQAKDLLKEIRETDNSRIRDYNRTMRMLRRVFRLRGGRE